MQRLEKVLLNHINPETPLILLVSGGKDSSALLHGLGALKPHLKFQPEVIHFNHLLRDDSSEDEAFVKNLSEKYEFKFKTFKINVLKYAEENFCSIEESARILRYDKTNDYVSGLKTPGIIFTAHTSNDQAETLLMRIISGSGRTGLQGIREVIPMANGWTLKRPFLELSTDDILGYLDSVGESYVRDKTNDELKYRRNYIRHKILPLMEHINPSVGKNISSLASILSYEEKFISDTVEIELEKLEIERKNESFCIEIKSVISYNKWLRLRILRRIAPLNISYRVTLALERLLTEGKTGDSTELGCGWRARVEYGSLFFEKTSDITAEFRRSIKAGDTLSLPEIERKVRTRIIGVSDLIFPPPGGVEYFDADSICSEELIVRSRNKGDRIIPFGMKGHKKVKDILIDMKVPRLLREKVMVIEDKDNIVWVAPFRRASFAPVTDKTRRVLEIKVSENG